MPPLDDKGKPKIGLVWAGSPTQQINHHRSCPIEEMLKITNDLDFDFYSLQLPVSSDDKTLLEKAGVHNLEQELVSYSHSGAIIQQLDLVVTVCTSVAHLAGALGVPTLVLLSPHADWRWLEDTDTSTWYPGTRLMHQKTSGDWAELIGRANTNLPGLLAD